MKDQSRLQTSFGMYTTSLINMLKVGLGSETETMKQREVWDRDCEGAGGLGMRLKEQEVWE